MKMKNLVSGNGGKVHAAEECKDVWGNAYTRILCGGYGSTNYSGSRSASYYIPTRKDITCKRCLKKAAPAEPAPAVVTKGYPVHPGLGRKPRARKSRNAGPKCLQELLEL